MIERKVKYSTEKPRKHQDHVRQRRRYQVNKKIDNIDRRGKENWKYWSLQITYGEWKRIDEVFSKL